jgi:hypothetical protein
MLLRREHTPTSRCRAFLNPDDAPPASCRAASGESEKPCDFFQFSFPQKPWDLGGEGEES